VVVPIWITSTSTPRRLLMIDSLAEQVLGPVSTNTRGRSSVGSGVPCVADKPNAVVWKPNGVNGMPVTCVMKKYITTKAFEEHLASMDPEGIGIETDGYGQRQDGIADIPTILVFKGEALLG